METGLRGPAGDTRSRQAPAPSDPTAGNGDLGRGSGYPPPDLWSGLGGGRHPHFADAKTETLGGTRQVQGHGKDRIIFVTKEDHETPSNAELVADDPNDPYEEHGLILPNGDINWNCPCLGGMASGPCGEQFKSAFSCFHYSTEEVKGSDCIDQFRAMQECMQKYPDLYPQEDEEEEEKKPPEPLEETAGPEATAPREEEGSS
ncbi:mitochondrial intermembrane space import and assembly protein 40 isoform X1 [Diceros bicornis minor]|uniref:mitochondrial intermembrane space import and assembly protein 40 isoform X1 n=1 Tax=Diceros bicornis minor TaxID=77932 RepID=UPI0026F17451|nr:mitochondrial intermembrane space import and assembly protein 40 isoform X1 [Diceros bicornis minor]